MSFATGAVTSATPTQKHTRSVTASLINAACACSRLTGARWSRCQWASGAPPGEKLAPSYQNLSKQNEWQAAWDVRPHHHHCFFFCLSKLTRNFTVQIRDYSYCLYDPPPKKILISRTKVMNKVGKCLSNTWWRDDEGQRLKGCKRTGERRKRLGEKGGQRREWF